MSKYRTFKRCGFHGFLGDTGYSIHNIQELRDACKSACLTTKDVSFVRLSKDGFSIEDDNIQKEFYYMLDPIIKKSVIESIVIRKNKIQKSSLSENTKYDDELNELDKEIDSLIDYFSTLLDFKKYNYNVIWKSKAVIEGTVIADLDGLIKFLVSHQTADLKSKSKETIYKTTGKMLLSGRKYDLKDSVYDYTKLANIENILDSTFVRDSLCFYSKIYMKDRYKMDDLVEKLGLYISSIRGFSGITGARNKEGYGYLFYSIYTMTLNFYLWMNASIYTGDNNNGICNDINPLFFENAYLVTIYPDGKFSYSVENLGNLRQALLNAWIDNLDRVYALYSSEEERESARREFYMSNCFGLVSEVYVPENKYMLLLPKNLKEDLSLEVQLESAINFMYKRDGSYTKRILKN